MTLGDNQSVTTDELRKIRLLDDFDLVMFVSEIHDHGWDVARNTLALMPAGKERNERQGAEAPSRVIATDFSIRVTPPPPEPGERCAVCNRRRNKPRTSDSPAARQIRITLPTDRMEAVENAFDALQEVTGIDPYSYPKGTLLEALLLLGGQQREQLRAHFSGDSE